MQSPSNVQVVDLGFRPRPWQAKSFRSRKRFNIEVVHRRGGKSVKAVMRLIDAALRCTKPNPRYGYIAPLLKQAKAIAWDYVKHYCRPIPGIVVNESELWVELPNHARIRIFGADNPDSLRGMYFDGVVLDEVADMKPDVWTAIIFPAILDRQGWADFIGTPKGINLFSELYYKALKDSDWYAALHTVYDTQALTPDEIEIAKASMPEAQFRQEFLCDFTAGSSNALISVDEAQAASLRHIQAVDYQFAARVLGVDVARQGDDRTVIFRRQGLASFKPAILKGADSMAVAGRVAFEIAEWQPDAVFVDGSGGYGAGVIDRLRQMGHACTEVQFGGKPLDNRYNNKRTEMYWTMAEWLKAGGAIPPMTDLQMELCTPTYTHDNARGVLCLESKDDIKERLGYSPDIADALALTFAFPTAPAPRGLEAQYGGRKKSWDYDPHAQA